MSSRFFRTFFKFSALNITSELILISDMKKAASNTKRQSGQQLTVRCTDEDAELFERAAMIEGADTSQRWMVMVCRKRARQIIQAAESGLAIRISETVIVPEEK